jgi:hypothetical protein
MAVSILGNSGTVVTSSRTLVAVIDLDYTFSTGLTETSRVITTNDSEIDHDALNNYEAKEHIDWTDGGENFSTDGSVYGESARFLELELTTGATVDSIETVLTDSDTKMPTSGAVADYVASEIISNSGMNVTRAAIAFDDDMPVTLQALGQNDVIWAIKAYITEGSSGTGDSYLKIGVTGDDDYYSSTTAIRADAGWQSMTWVNDPVDEPPRASATDVILTIDVDPGEEPQALVYIWYSTH